jgi:hypothetical protein
MLKLAEENKLTIRVVDGEVVHSVAFTWREPTTPAWVEYRRRLIAVDTDQRTDDEAPSVATMQSRLAQLDIVRDLACECMLEVEGIEGPKGMDAIEAVQQFAPYLLEKLGNAIANRLRHVEAEAGKSEPPPA